MTLAKFIRDNDLSLAVVPADSNPNTPGMARNWTCEIWRWQAGKPMAKLTTPFSQGSAHKQAPTLSDVLDCLASDASSIRNARDFEDWASDFGYDTDSRKAFATWEACLKQATELETLLGSEAFHTLIYDVERL